MDAKQKTKKKKVPCDWEHPTERSWALATAVTSTSTSFGATQNQDRKKLVSEDLEQQITSKDLWPVQSLQQNTNKSLSRFEDYYAGMKKKNKI